MRHTALPLLSSPLCGLAVACGPPDPLADTPIHGGTPEVRAAVRAELVAFDAATGGGRTRVARVKIRELEVPGRLERITNTIALSDALVPADAAFALRHELCHALDDVDGPLADERPALYERLVAGLLATEDPPHRGPEREVVAAYCALGPWPAQLVRAACPGEPADAQRVMDHLWDRVWTGAPWIPVAAEPPAWASVDVGAAPRDLRVIGAGDGRVHLAWRVDGGDRDGVFDLRTGDAVPVTSRLPDETASASGLPPGLPGKPAVRITGVGWPEGPAAAVLTVPLYHLGAVDRLVVSDGESWAVLGDGCVEGPPFAADGRVFTLRVNGSRIGWGPVP